MQNKRSQIAFFSLSIVGLLLVIAGASYSWLSLSVEAKKTQQMIVGNLEVLLDESMGEGISVADAYPVSDATGLTGNPYTFTLENKGDSKVHYTIRLIDDEVAKTACTGCDFLSDNVMRYTLRKNDSSITPNYLSSVTNRLLETGTMEIGEKNTYQLRLWLAENAGNEAMNRYFYGKVEVVATQVEA